MADTTLRGRRAYEQRAWSDAYDALREASLTEALGSDDVERLAWSAILSGRDEPAFEAFERLHQLRMDAGEPRLAARAAFLARAAPRFARRDGASQRMVRPERHLVHRL
jgi:hypothetical protein